jgi:hypothetical protein
MNTNTDDVTNKLTGLPTAEELKQLYINQNFDRLVIAKHLGMTIAQLNRFKKKMLGDCVLPSYPTYMRQYNEVTWYTGKHAEWTHVKPATICKGNSNDN